MRRSSIMTSSATLQAGLCHGCHLVGIVQRACCKPPALSLPTNPTSVATPNAGLGRLKTLYVPRFSICCSLRAPLRKSIRYWSVEGFVIVEAFGIETQSLIQLLTNPQKINIHVRSQRGHRRFVTGIFVMPMTNGL